jgi:hypothetical protein
MRTVNVLHAGTDWRHDGDASGRARRGLGGGPGGSGPQRP